ncbi:MAG: AmmeMemoRadiSam system protein B [Patescibacteria group bacterium]|jgi:aromatic ring-opening dioxygenase LigB subunit
MSLVFAAITPHPPVLIPSIGKDNIKQIEKTKTAMEHLEKDLYASKPEVLLIISPHGDMKPDAFTINVCENYEINFEDFGDFSTKLNIRGEMVLISMNTEKIASKVPLNIISEPKLDHGAGIPLYYLSQHLDKPAVIPVGFSLLDNVAHFEFGKALKELIMDTDKRIAVIASGDMSHCLTESAPLPYSSSGKEFDEKIIKLLEDNDYQGIVHIDPQLVKKASECGLRSILILLGILNNINCKTEIVSYEAPFGVGYLVANFKLE